MMMYVMDWDSLVHNNWKILFHLSHGIREISFRNFWSNGKPPIRTGNSIHDELFDRQGVNVSPEDAIAAVGELCQVGGIAQEFDLFGAQPFHQLENIVHSVLQKKLPFHIIVAHFMAMLMIVASDGQLILVDSYMHGSKGALIARGIPFQGLHAHWFSLWFDRMLISTCGSGLSVCSISTLSIL